MPWKNPEYPTTINAPITILCLNCGYENGEHWGCDGAVCPTEKNGKDACVHGGIKPRLAGYPRELDSGLRERLTAAEAEVSRLKKVGDEMIASIKRQEEREGEMIERIKLLDEDNTCLVKQSNKLAETLNEVIDVNWELLKSATKSNGYTVDGKNIYGWKKRALDAEEGAKRMDAHVRELEKRLGRGTPRSETPLTASRLADNIEGVLEKESPYARLSPTYHILRRLAKLLRY